MPASKADQRNFAQTRVSLFFGIVMTAATVKSAYEWFHQGTTPSTEYTVVTMTVLFGMMSAYFFVQSGSAARGISNPFDKWMKPYLSLLLLLIFIAFVVFALAFLPKIAGR